MVLGVGIQERSGLKLHQGVLHNMLQSTQCFPLLSDGGLRCKQHSPCLGDGVVLGQYIGLA